jgi:hypothetical protein
MKTHNWIMPAGKHAKIGPATRLAEAAIGDSPAQTARAMLILALVVGGGAESTVATAGSNYAAAATTIVPATHTHAVAHPWLM